MLCQGEYWSEAAGAEHLKILKATLKSGDDWLQHRSKIRSMVLEGAGLDPLPKRGPLKPVFHSRRNHRGYTVENLYFESLPGVLVTGSLYRPEKANTHPPGFLVAHGHGKLPGRSHGDTQKLCGTLARMGALVLAHDMVGFGELKALGWNHHHPTALKLQTWNSMRALDLLLESGADSSRLAVTGASGGGTQSFLLSAMDDRVSLSIPVVQVSAHFFGGCSCESGMPIHFRDGLQSTNVEIAALFAPKPQLLMSSGADATRNTAQVEFPFIRRVYDLLGSQHVVENLHLHDEGHDYGRSKRMGACRFISRHFNLPDFHREEGDIVIEPHEAMAAFTPEHPLPAHALHHHDAIVWS